MSVRHYSATAYYTSIMRTHPVRTAAWLIAALLLAGCSADRSLEPCLDEALPAAGLADARPRPSTPLPATPFDPLFHAAGTAHGVDPALLKAIAWVETRFHMVRADHDGAGHDHHGQAPAWGVMALRGDRLARAARLAGLTAAEVRRSPAANIHAAAALLAAEAHAAGVAGLGPGSWTPAVERFSGIELPAGRAAYARDAVLPALARVGSAAAGAAAGAVTANTAAIAARVPAHCRDPRMPPVPPSEAPPAPVVWRASPNFDTRMAGAGGDVALVIIHTCEGSYTGCWSWLTNRASGVSAHYVIDEDGAEVSHLVEEPLRAWHIGARYDCALNHGRRCDLAGVQSNHFTIGVEHAGYASQPAFPSGQIDTSARLVCAITQRHGIPRDGQHIVAHGLLQPWNRTDPGANWPWTRFLALVQRHCGEVVVDDDVAHNDAAFARVAAPAVWTATAATPGFHGAGYRWAPAHPDHDDAVVFEFLVERAGSHVLEARWTAGPNRAAAAHYTVRDPAGGTLATAQLDQRAHHDEWRPIAALELAAGWHRVELSRRGTAGAVVVADAVRARR
jgi:N-acetyl-anhydromuramyl-L-alanine amidase AmpD